MSLLAVGLSHHSATVELLERASIPPADTGKVLHELVRGDHVDEAMLLSTCNRVEIYADVAKFHAGLHEVTSVLARQIGLDVAELADHLYVHYEDAVAQHVFRVAAGLDSMVVGESQILGQLRQAYADAVAEQTAGRALHELAQKALAVGKRAHSDTDIDRAGASVVAVGLEQAAAVLGPLQDRTALVVGAGAMGALASATLRRLGVRDLVVANRTAERADRLAESVDGRVVEFAELATELARADLVVGATGAVGVVVPVDVVEQAVQARAGRPLVILDLALPRDIDPAAGELPDVTYIDMDALRPAAEAAAERPEVEAAAALVDGEVESYLAARRAEHVTPTVTALRTRASEVVEAELTRLDGKLPELDPQVRDEVARSIRRTVSTLLHTPTVRVKKLAESPEGGRYAEALRELFQLDPSVIESVTGLPEPERGPE